MKRIHQDESLRIKYEIGFISLLAISILVIVSLWNKDTGVIGIIFSGVLFNTAGIGAYLIPPSAIILGVIMLVRMERLKFSSTASGFIILFIIILTFLQIYSPAGLTERYPESATVKNLKWGYGGLIGNIFLKIFRTCFGTVGTYIVLFTLAIISIVMITDVPLLSRLQTIKGAVVNLFKNFKDFIKVRKTAKDTVEEDVPIKEEYIEPEIPKVVESEVEDRTKEEQLDLIPEEKIPKKSIYAGYKLPPINLLKAYGKPPKRITSEINENANIIEETLHNFDIDVKVVHIESGPTVTRYELQPPPGVKISRISELSNDIALSLAAPSVRVEAPIPGKSLVGIEVPNKKITLVNLKEILETKEFRDSTSKLIFALGKDITGHPIITDLGKMPHLLIAGATGSGKTICINSIICSILFRAKPNEVKFIMVDPKRVELIVYNDIPHLYFPVITDFKKTGIILKWIIREMETRYDMFAKIGVRNIEGYNSSISGDSFMPYIVVVIDELADLMLMAPVEVEEGICRLAQLARATGIHLVIATQRPTVDIITGTIKANISSRIAFAVASQVDSRTILDMNGAEKLVGSGDMLYLPIDAAKPTRIQGAYISEEEINNLVKFISQQGKPEYIEPYEKEEYEEEYEFLEDDELIDKAIRLVVSSGNASISFLQRKLRIGHTRAARLIDIMEERGIVGGFEGSKPRRILVGKEYLYQ